MLFDEKQRPPICGCRCGPSFKTRHDWVKTKTKVFLSPFPFQNFLASTSCPEIQGYLYVKELGRKSWKKVYMFLRRSGLYCSTKGTSKVTVAHSFHLQRAELISIQQALFVLSSQLQSLFVIFNHTLILHPILLQW